MEITNSDKSVHLNCLPQARAIGFCPPGDDDDQHCRPRGRFTFRAVRKCISNPVSCRSERDFTTGESRIQEGSMRWHPAFATPDSFSSVFW